MSLLTSASTLNRFCIVYKRNMSLRSHLLKLGRGCSKSSAAKTSASKVPKRQRATVAAVAPADESILPPTPSGADKQYPPKITKLVNDISKLTLLEVSDLNELLKKTLNIQDAPMMTMGAVAAAPAAPAEEEEVVVKKVQTAFKVKLLKIDDTKKVAIIKEIKNSIDGMNLVQAKKFVESVPQIVKADVGKEEAEKLKAALEAAGATCELE